VWFDTHSASPLILATDPPVGGGSQIGFCVAFGYGDLCFAGALTALGFRIRAVLTTLDDEGEGHALWEGSDAGKLLATERRVSFCESQAPVIGRECRRID